VPLLIATLVLLCFVILGVRAAFALPLELRANWVFRVTAVHSPAAYFGAVRKGLFALAAAPAWILSALLCFAVWPARPALAHMLVMIATGTILVEIACYRFRKLPFACSYLPGKANLNVKLGIYGILFLIGVDLGVGLESWAIRRPVRFAVFFGLLAAAAIWARRRTSQFIASRYNQVQFEDVPPAEISTLDLGAEGGSFVNEPYLDTSVSARVR
jgi:hypothetical protein